MTFRSERSAKIEQQYEIYKADIKGFIEEVTNTVPHRIPKPGLENLNGFLTNVKLFAEIMLSGVNTELLSQNLLEIENLIARKAMLKSLLKPLYTLQMRLALATGEQQDVYNKECYSVIQQLKPLDDKPQVKSHPETFFKR